MDKPKLNVTRLQKLDPAAWTALVQRVLGSKGVKVKAVKAVKIHTSRPASDYPPLSRYFLKLAGHSDPITFIGKHTNGVETAFYQNVASLVPQLAPTCHFATLSGDRGWIVMDDVPDHFPPHKWAAADVEEIANQLAGLHYMFQGRHEQLLSQGLAHFIGEKAFTWHELRAKEEVLFDEGPAAVISEHAIDNAGRLAPLLLKAANGLTIIRDLGGWPGILGESHLAAAADLLDDPVPMLEPLRQLPLTLIHGDPYNYHWQLTLFEEMRLLDWRRAAVGPGVYDLISFTEQFDLLYLEGNNMTVRVRQDRPVTDETIVDSYLLSMSAKLGRRFNARAVRQALPAARCLHVLLNWFPQFAKWFSKMPSKYTWQKINRMADDRLLGTPYESLIAFRPYLAALFGRFLHAYRTL